MDEGVRNDCLEFWLACGLDARDWPAASAAYDRTFALIQAHNADAGLVGRVRPADFYYKHVADSLAVLSGYRNLLLDRPVRLADVGCGAGLPGLILAIALPKLQLVAVDSDHDKASFVILAAEALGLSERVEAVALRSRDMQRNIAWRGQFPLITARAVASADKLIRDCRQLLSPGGSLLLYKTPRLVKSELPLAQRECDKFGLTLHVGPEIALPANSGRRQFLQIQARE